MHRIRQNFEKVPKSFYQSDNVVFVAKALLGMLLVTKIEEKLCAGIITETEAYCGRNDAACHANNGLRTKRTEMMYAEGGKAYVYLCYGIHKLFNVVTNVEGKADAVLVRGVEPIVGQEFMLNRRKMAKLENRISAGPGCLAQALGITRKHYGLDLCDSREIWVERPINSSDSELQISEAEIERGPRVGVAYAGKDALKPWRFWLKGNAYVSKARPSY